MKFYDKELTKKSNTINTSILILIVFIFGFIIGYFSNKYEEQYLNFNEKNNIKINLLEV